MFFKILNLFSKRVSSRYLQKQRNFSFMIKSPDETTEIVAIVDKDNNVIGKEYRNIMREQRMIHRSTYIFILTSDNKFHVQKRTMTKKWCPGYWDIVSGGVVQHNESYEENAQRELEEEFGLKVPLKPLFLFYFEDETARIWGKSFLGRNDGPLKLQEEEVESVEIMTKEEIEERIKKGEKFTPDCIKAYEIFLKEKCELL